MNHAWLASSFSAPMRRQLRGAPVCHRPLAKSRRH
jgi:hypothetical protein